VAGRKAGASNPAGSIAQPTPWKWFPLHESSLHVVMACRHIGRLVEICKVLLAKCAAVGVTHGYYECGQPGHWSHDCSSKVPFPGGPGSRGEGLVGARPGRGAYPSLPGRAHRGRGNCLAAAGIPGRGAREHLGDVATTYGGDVLPPHHIALRHSPREPAGSDLPPAPLGVTA
jgi:hypothetical protein